MDNSEIGLVVRNIERAKSAIGMNDAEIAAAMKVSKSTVHRIMKGGNTALLPELARALGVSMGYLFGEVDLKTYNMTDAPVCQDDYYLRLDAAELGLSELKMPGTIIVLVVPYDDEAASEAIRVLYRYHKSSRNKATVCVSSAFGPERVLAPVGLLGDLTESLRPDNRNGQILGAIRDVVSLKSLFYRS